MKEQMDLRDWFAGQALAGIVATASSKEMMATFTEAAKARGIHEEELVAAQAYSLADAMIAARQSKE